MCGIAGIYLRDPSIAKTIDLDDILSTMLAAIDHRGGDATGYVAIGDDGVLDFQKAACDAVDFCKYRREVPRGARVLLAHTRWATQGLPAFTENNHPLRRGAFFVIHNGHILNDWEILNSCGKRPLGQVDSEAIVARLSQYGSLDRLPEVMEELRGQAAVAAVDERRGDRLTLARGFMSPLVVLETKRLVLFGSTRETVEKAYETHIGSAQHAQITELAEGTCIHYEGRERRETEFKPYRPPVVVPTSKPPAALTTGKSPTGWDEDYMDCDDCGVWVPWRAVNYVEDAETGLTVARCADCQRWEDEGYERYDSSDDFSFVNRAVLDDSRWSAPGTFR